MNEYMEKTILEFLKEKLSPFWIILFGSTVKGNEHTDSDIDIAFVSEDTELDKYELFIIAQELAVKLNRDVDLIDLRQASTVFQAQILHTGKTIYCSDTQKKAYYEIKTLKMYAKLNEERAEILKKIDERGAIYEK